jgi:hypothetical protein
MAGMESLSCSSVKSIPATTKRRYYATSSGSHYLHNILNAMTTTRIAKQTIPLISDWWLTLTEFVRKRLIR